MKTRFELETMEMNRENIKELVNELKELNSHLYFKNVLECYKQGIIEIEDFEQPLIKIDDFEPLYDEIFKKKNEE